MTTQKVGLGVLRHVGLGWAFPWPLLKPWNTRFTQKAAICSLFGNFPEGDLLA